MKEYRWLFVRDFVCVYGALYGRKKKKKKKKKMMMMMMKKKKQKTHAADVRDSDALVEIRGRLRGHTPVGFLPSSRFCSSPLLLLAPLAALDAGHLSKTPVVHVSS